MTEFLLCVHHIEFMFRVACSHIHVCDSFLSGSLEVSLASAWISNDRVDPWKANTQNIGYVSLRCAFMLSEHEVANIEHFFKTRVSAHTGGELLSTSLSVASRRVLRQIFLSFLFLFFFFSGWLLVRLASFRRGALRMGEEYRRLLHRLDDSVHDTVVLLL